MRKASTRRSAANLMKAPETQNNKWQQFDRGFTFLELLVIVGLLALLACVMSPVLARSRPSSNAAQCLANMRQLMTAWTMYTHDSRGILPPNRDGATAGKSSGDASWAGGWLDYSFSTDNTNIAMLIDHVRMPYAAYLGPYLQTASAFRCPSDCSMVTIAGQKMARVRSVSMNNSVGTMTRSWTLNQHRLYPTLASMVVPKPSELFVLCDEREDGINDPVFMVDPDTRFQLVDYPGAYHGNAGTFGFVDGHVELHGWQDPRTVPLLLPGQLLPLNQNLPGDLDVDWIHQHCSAKR